MLLKLRTRTRGRRGKAGDTQSNSIAASLKKSAASLHALHSGSRLVPSFAAKRIVATRPVDSCRTDRSRAAVGEALASPTPTPAKLQR